MLSYQHGYHAGSFADVVKHLTQTRIINYLTKKDKPLFYLETHAGAGLYDLSQPMAQKIAEHEDGIVKLWQQKDSLPELFQPYLKVIEGINPKGDLRYYPGSPYLAIQGLREEDRLICCELHPREFEALSSVSTHNKKVFWREEDGLQQLAANLPPPENRGLIFIDPSYELKDDYKTIPRLLKKAYQHFSQGTYCLWYPLIDNYWHEKMQNALNASGFAHTLCINFKLKPFSSGVGMYGCGMYIINPPYTLAKEMREGLAVIAQILNPKVAVFHLEEKGA